MPRRKHSREGAVGGVVQALAGDGTNQWLPIKTWCTALPPCAWGRGKKGGRL